MNLDDYLATLIESGQTKPCGRCKEVNGLTIHLMVEGMHWGKVVCLNCDEAFVTWAPRPDKVRRPRDGRSKRLLDIIRDSMEGEPLYCEMCLWDERAPRPGKWMEAHHVLEVQDGGFDHIGNLRPLCNRCHALVHWVRNASTDTQVGKERHALVK